MRFTLTHALERIDNNINKFKAVIECCASDTDKKEVQGAINSLEVLKENLLKESQQDEGKDYIVDEYYYQLTRPPKLKVLEILNKLDNKELDDKLSCIDEEFNQRLYPWHIRNQVKKNDS